MIVVLEIVGGPLDGTLEFDEYGPWPEERDRAYTLRRGVYDITQGKIGSASSSPSPGLIDRHFSGNATDFEAQSSTLHVYTITHNELKEGKRYVRASHMAEHRRPVNRPESGS